jgi:hypothetical protein
MTTTDQTKRAVSQKHQYMTAEDVCKAARNFGHIQVKFGSWWETILSIRPERPACTQYFAATHEANTNTIELRILQQNGRTLYETRREP